MKNLNYFLTGVIAGLLGVLAARRSIKALSFFGDEWWKDLDSHSDHTEDAAAQAVKPSL